MKACIKNLFFLPALIAGLGLMLAESANGQSGVDSNGFAWYSNDGSTAQITGYSGPGGNVAIPSIIIDVSHTNVIYYSTTAIGAYAFSHRTSLTSVTIPGSVTSIGINAFEYCSSLAGVTIPGSVTSIGNSTFQNCTSLTSLTIPGSVISIGANAFGGCTSLASLTIPGSVTSIGDYAFYGTSLSSVTIPGSVISIGSGAFEYCSSLTSITIPDSVTSIGDSAFVGCTSLTSATIGNSVTSIGGAFVGCTNLTSAAIGNGVTSIAGAFVGCTNLANVTIGNGVTSIGSYTFESFHRLASVTIGNGVTNIGYAAFDDCTSLTSITIPGSVFSIGQDAFAGCTSLASATIGNSVTNIGSGAFAGCTSLTSVTIPNGVTSIGEGAFAFCTSLTSVAIPGSVTSIGLTPIGMFEGCIRLAAVMIGNGVTNIGSGAFAGCTNLASLTIPGSVASIGSYSFQNFHSLTSVTIGNGVTNIGFLAFAGTSLTSITIPGSVTSIGLRAFEVCTNLASVTILPGSGISIGEDAFDYCTSLTSATIASGVTNIGVAAFEDCTSLASVTIPGSVTSIGFVAFEHCTSMTNVTILPGSATGIGDSAFVGCTSLAAVTIGTGVTSIGGAAFYDCTSLTSVTIPNSVTNIGEGAFEDCTSLTNLTIAKGVTSIGDDAFDDCTSLTSVTIPNSVTNIGEGAFYYCTSLTSATIGNGATSIGDETFYYCTSLQGVMIGNSVTNIGWLAFGECTSLTSVTIPGSVTNIGEEAFAGCTSLTFATIGNGVTNIGWLAFVNCTNLASVCFEGNEPADGGDIFGADSALSTIYYVNGTTGWGATFSGVKTAPCTQCGPTLVPLRVSLPLANAFASDSIDAPIVPVTDPNALSTAAALGKGVVADDVTPVLFQFTGPATNYTLEITHDALAYSNGQLSDRISVLQGGSWTPTMNLSVSSFGSSGKAYAYMQGLRWNDFAVLFGNNNQVHVTLNIHSTSDGSIVASTNFLVRPPPIALVHGIADDNTAWSYLFTNTLALYCPGDFIIPVQYGVGSGSKDQNGSQWPNATWPFDKLSPSLDAALANQFETPLHANWAFTRYDVVGHSQGGVLLRMLCQIDNTGHAPFSLANIPIVSLDNLYRGRFRRVITLGSPHNGSLLAWYIWELELSPGILEQAVFTLLAGHTPMKFDPFGHEIHEINESDYLVDSRIKFNCIRTTIAGGHFPDSAHNPLCYNILGLADVVAGGANTRGSVLLPNGSDGVVDYFSEGGGADTPVTPITDSDIAHADVVPDVFPVGFIELFGVPSGQSQTTYAEVAGKIGILLNGPTNAFGAFQLPTLLTPSTEQYYSSLIPGLVVGQATIQQQAQPAIPSTNVNYALQIPMGFPIGGSVNWYAQVFGTNGVSTVGVYWQVNTNNSTLVTVSIAGGTHGTVVLYGSYSDTNGDLVLASPVVVASDVDVTSLKGIQLNPPTANMSAGDVLPTTIWGNYTNGANTLLYIPFGQAQYTSSNTNVARIDAGGRITMNSAGAATITVSYQGFSAKTLVSTITPFITSQPQSVTVVVGSNATFSVTAQGMNPLGYQWLVNGTNLTDNGHITGSQSNVLTLTSVTAGNSGTYEVIVTNIYGSSNAFATLTVATPSYQFSYTTNNGTITITGYTGPGGAVTIPSTINNLPVTSIGDYAFYGTSLTSVTIPGSVTNIGDEAFEYCWGLTSVTIPSSVTSVGDYAFSGCNLTNVTIPSSVTNIGTGAFSYCYSLVAITVDASNSVYGSVGVVLFNKSLTTLIQYPDGLAGSSYTIPNSVTSIGDYAFSGCNLTNVSIPGSVTNIGAEPFSYCYSLMAITVDASNSVYASVGGVLFNKSLTTLIQYPDGMASSSYTIPASVTSIGDYAFSGCNLTSLTIPSSVTNIGAGAFEYCGLTGVYFQGNAPNLGLYAFNSDYSTVYYLPGTSNWGTTFGGLPTALWSPQVETGGNGFGVQTNQFGFNINWVSGMVVVVEASTDLAHPVWSPVATNTLTGGSSYFSDPQWTNYHSRFYRVRSP